jgi:hypothetical protein
MFSTRRSLFRSAGAILGAPAVLSAGKSGSRRPVVGSGAWQYEVIHDWGGLPRGLKYGNTHGVVEDSQGHIYVHHTVHATSERHDSMVVFDAKGKFVRSFGKEFRGGAHGLHIRKEGSQEFLYLCDTQRNIVVKTTTMGEEVFTLGYPEQSPAYQPAGGAPVKYKPTNLAVAPNGDIYVGDGYGSSFINVYDKNGKFRFTFGGKGKEAGQLDCPHGLTIDARGREPLVMVADRTNNRLQQFSLEGNHLGFVTGVNLPCHFDERKGVFVIPDLAARVTLLGPDNQVIAHLGEGGGNWRQIRTKAREAFEPGKFICPHGACFDRKGNIYVVEWVEVGRVTKLRKLG